MTEAVGGYRAGAACFEDSREQLEGAAEDLAEAEHELERELGLAIVNTVKVALLCVGGPGRMQAAGCVVAAAQHLHALFELSQQADEYERKVEEHEAALAAHLTCISG